MIIEQKENKTFFRIEESSIKLFELEKGLYRIRIDKLEELNSEDKGIMIDKFIEFSKENNCSILTEENKPENNFLLDLGFEVYRSKTLFNKKLTKLEIIENELTYKSLKDLTKPEFLETFISSVTDYEEMDGMNETDYLDYLIELAEDKFDASNWKIAYLNNQPIGVILPQIFPDNDKEGTLYFVGLIKEYRNKGFGKDIHLEGLNCLYNLGATDYIGSTLNTNLAMIKLFKKNNCEVEVVQNFFRL